MGVYWKIQLLGGGSRKTNIEWVDCLKRGAWTVDLREGWQERGHGVLEGGWYPDAHYELSQNHLIHVLIQPSVIASNWCVRG